MSILGSSNLLWYLYKFIDFTVLEKSGEYFRDKFIVVSIQI